MRTSLALAGLLLLAGLFCAGTTSAARTNRGGALVLHVEGEARYEYGSLANCASLALTDPDAAVIEAPSDGKVRLVGLYAVFPPDSVGSIKALSYGIRYSPNVRIVGWGACSGGGLELLLNAWPASHGGISVNIDPSAVRESRVIPLYWFALSCLGPGSFEVIPHPMAKFAGRFVNTDAPPLESPVVDYGRIGFGSPGKLAHPGPTPPIGPCCLDQCWLLTPYECEVYSGLWLGENSRCEEEPCGQAPRLGGCCVDDGCDALTAVECARAGGYFLGEGVACPAQGPCPPPTAASTTPAETGGEEGAGDGLGEEGAGEGR